MKKCISLLTMLLFSISAYSQEFPKETDESQMIFVKTGTIEGKTKDQIFSKAKLVIADIYNSASDVVKSEDKEDGNIIVKGILFSGTYMVTLHVYPYHVNNTVRIDIKDGKYRIIIYNLTHISDETKAMSNIDGGPLSNEKDQAGMCMTKGNWKTIKEKAIVEANDLLNKIDSKIQSASSSKSDDW